MIWQADQPLFISGRDAFAFDGSFSAVVVQVGQLHFADVVFYEIVAGAKCRVGWLALRALWSLAGGLSGWRGPDLRQGARSR